jgi:hypothetical protein
MQGSWTRHEQVFEHFIEKEFYETAFEPIIYVAHAEMSIQLAY